MEWEGDRKNWERERVRARYKRAVVICLSFAIIHWVLDMHFLGEKLLAVDWLYKRRWFLLFYFISRNWFFQVSYQMINVSYFSFLVWNCLANERMCALCGLPSVLVFFNFSVAIVILLSSIVMMLLSKYNSCCLALCRSTDSFSAPQKCFSFSSSRVLFRSITF